MAALRQRGIDWLAPSDATPGKAVDAETLIASLAAQPDTRLRQALIGLFLLQPELAPIVPGLRAQLDDRAAQELLAHYTAAVYLQRMWRIRLGHYLESVAELPDYFSNEMGLPSPADEYGRAGLVALAEWHAEKSPYRLNHLSAYEGVADLLFQSLKLKRRALESEAAG